MSFLERFGWMGNGESRGQYSTVDEHDDGSNKEGKDESLALQEQHRSLLEAHRRLKAWLRGVCVSSGLVVLILVVALFYPRSSPASTRMIPTPVPDMPHTLITFQENSTFAGPSTQENDEAWSALMPPGDGFILVDSPFAYSLPPGKSSKHGQVYDISLFHQLHCLAHIRNHYYLSQQAIHSNMSAAIEEVLLGPQEDHVRHCFDYLRQGIMCAGDMTLEWPRTEEDGRRFAVDGWGVTHECKSWDAIMEFMKENDVANRIWTA